MRAILTYHSVDPSGSPVSVDPATFLRQLDWLAEGPVRVTDVETLLGLSDDADAVALTFDDGFANFANVAWPLLNERSLPATLFVVAGRVGTDNRWNGQAEEGIPRRELLDWDELSRLAAEGVTLASHGMTHRPLGGGDPDRIRRELADSRALIRERTGVDPRGFAYPYGDADDFCRQVAAAHFDWACTTELAPLDRSDRTYALPRLDTYYFRGRGSLERWGTRPFLWRLRVRRWARRVRRWARRVRAVGSEARRGAADTYPTAAAGGARVVNGAAFTVARAGERRDAEASGPASESPDLSVIVPAHRAAEELHDSLSALLTSDLPRERWELVVVNDGADTETLAVARRYADEVIALKGKPRGPGYARNRGAEVARGEVLVFVDADVRVHGDTLERFLEVLEEEPDVAAVFGAYDDRPPGPGFVSAYRNLLHHLNHVRNPGEAETFWAGCGAVRRDVFEQVGCYDEWHFSRPQIEDIELGRRIRRAGHRILLRPDIRATHLKRWSLGAVLRTDLVSRGIPWMRLVLQEGESDASRTLNLSARHRWCVALVGLAALTVPTALVFGTLWPLAVAFLALGVVTALNLDFYDLVRRRKGWVGLLFAVPLHLLHYLCNGISAIAGWMAYVMVGPPLPPVDAAAFREAGMEPDELQPLPSPPSNSLWYRYDD